MSVSGDWHQMMQIIINTPLGMSFPIVEWQGYLQSLDTGIISGGISESGEQQHTT